MTFTDQQLAAVEADPYQHTLVLAGAGSGKTRVLIGRIKYLITHGYARPKEIITVTFTNKAADEIKARLQAEGINVSSMWTGTFHSVCVRLLRRYACLLGFTSSFTIYDEDDSIKLLGELLKQKGKKLESQGIKQVASWIQTWKADGFSPDKVSQINIDDPLFILAKEVYPEYQQALFWNNAMDFDDLILHACKLVREFTQVRQFLSGFKYFFIDEYQDTSVIQDKLVEDLANLGLKVFAVGDDYQSIYGWRNARMDNILTFTDRYPGTQVYYLTQNFRSTQVIVSAANEVILNNVQQMHKVLQSQTEYGELIEVNGFATDRQEGEWIALTVKQLVSSGQVTPDEVAVLCRTNAILHNIESYFILHNIPYRMVGDVSFFDHAEIKDTIAMLSLLANPRDNLAAKRVLGLIQGVGNKTIEQLEKEARNRGVSIFELIASGYSPPRCNSRTKTGLKLAASILTIDKEKSLPTIITDLWRHLAYHNYLQKHYSQDLDKRLNNLQQLIALAEDIALCTGSFIEAVDRLLLNAVDEGGDCSTVSLLTIHSAKGLEFDVVFIAGCEEGTLPSCFSAGDDGLEEERRLMYVALTRARKKVYLTYAVKRRVFGNGLLYLAPSRFIGEIPVCLRKHTLFGKQLKEDDAYVHYL